jgi:hypothetical protein
MFVVRTYRYAIANKHTTRTQHCRHIIVAFPPNLSGLAAFDLDAQQRAVFDRVRVVQYISGAMNLPKSKTGPASTVNMTLSVYIRLLKLTGNTLQSMWAALLMHMAD